VPGAANAGPAGLRAGATAAPGWGRGPLRGRPNRRARGRHVYEFVAGLRGVSLDELAAQVEANVRTAFPRVVG
jgi:Tat protein secretion system quality control protein TatD with DNase activity